MRRRNYLSSFEKTLLSVLLAITILLFLIPILIPRLNYNSRKEYVIRVIAGAIVIALLFILLFKFVLA